MTKLSDGSIATYESLRGGAVGYRESSRGATAVWGSEAVQFLNGLVTNDVAKLDEGGRMAAAFPNAQGRLLALVQIFKAGDRFIFVTEEATRKKIFDNLFRFTFAGDFFIEDVSEQYRFFETVNHLGPFAGGVGDVIPKQTDEAESFVEALRGQGALGIPEDVYEVLRIESCVPVYGIDVDESTVVPEVGSEGLISYNKGCYIGQEVVARIHFRGHVAKELRVLEFDCEAVEPGTELTSGEGKSAGKVTSSVWSPRTQSAVGLSLVRYEFLADGTELSAGDARAVVRKIPIDGTQARQQ